MSNATRHEPWWDSSSLNEFLQRQIAPGVVVANAKRLSGGAIQENWCLTLRHDDGHSEEVVLRCNAASHVSESRSRAEEYHLLCVAEAAGVTVAKPLALGDDCLGRDFFIMAKAAGTGAAHRLVRDPRLHGNNGDQFVENIGREIARLHKIAANEPLLKFLPALTDTPSTVGIAQCRAYLAQHHQSHPALQWALRWLEQNQPKQQGVSLCHRDFRTGNFLVDATQLTAILDWEFAAWSDPMEDIGWFCARCWRFGEDAREAGGIGSREAFYRGYERESSHSINAQSVYFWEVYAHVRWAVIALQQAERMLSGTESSLELGLTAHVVPELELELLRMTGASPTALARPIPHH